MSHRKPNRKRRKLALSNHVHQVVVISHRVRALDAGIYSGRHRTMASKHQHKAFSKHKLQDSACRTTTSPILKDDSIDSMPLDRKGTGLVQSSCTDSRTTTTSTRVATIVLPSSSIAPTIRSTPSGASSGPRTVSPRVPPSLSSTVTKTPSSGNQINRVLTGVLLSISIIMVMFAIVGLHIYCKRRRARMCTSNGAEAGPEVQRQAKGTFANPTLPLPIYEVMDKSKNAALPSLYDPFPPPATATDSATFASRTSVDTCFTPRLGRRPKLERLQRPTIYPSALQYPVASSSARGSLVTCFTPRLGHQDSPSKLPRFSELRSYRPTYGSVNNMSESLVRCAYYATTAGGELTPAIEATNATNAEVRVESGDMQPLKRGISDGGIRACQASGDLRRAQKVTTVNENCHQRDGNPADIGSHHDCALTSMTSGPLTVASAAPLSQLRGRHAPPPSSSYYTQQPTPHSPPPAPIPAYINPYNRLPHTPIHSPPQTASHHPPNHFSDATTLEQRIISMYRYQHGDRRAGFSSSTASSPTYSSSSFNESHSATTTTHHSSPSPIYTHNSSDPDFSLQVHHLYPLSEPINVSTTPPTIVVFYRNAAGWRTSSAVVVPNDIRDQNRKKRGQLALQPVLFDRAEYRAELAMSEPSVGA